MGSMRVAELVDPPHSLSDPLCLMARLWPAPPVASVSKSAPGGEAENWPSESSPHTIISPGPNFFITEIGITHP
jgi:hypothetical protein